MSEQDIERHDRAIAVLARMQRSLIRRLCEYVTENDSSLRLAADGAEGYGYTVHQIDELFLSKLNLIERTIAELQKFPVGGASRYRTQCFTASRGEVEREINSRLEKLTDARILAVSVSPGARGGEQDSASDPASEPDISDPARRPDETDAEGEADASGGGSDERIDGGESPEDRLLVTVLYYGPAPRAT